ncbi:hypothetical protein [Caulobacter sp. NIBR1757]|uniref:energy transducer TonB n=1 Tax=Caulobacter sp. NIBR1757 TaxID=3016000 RepID=UPI0022EFDEC1|nr:hypothetical protein [Caulobacter sp. NIBR1757]WGM38219.1 hypothetical protein AMEJIAPC_01121 [Caulobacter sp. NIBR1757]
MTLLRLFPALLLAALVVAATGAPAHSAPSCEPVRTIGLYDIPTVVSDIRFQALRADGQAPCADYLLRIPIDWTEDGADGAISLSTVDSPYAAVDLPQIVLKDPTGVIRAEGRESYSVTPGKAVARPRSWTRAELNECRAALGRYSAEVCDTPNAEFAVTIRNPDDIALTRRVPLSIQQRGKARLTGLFLLVAFRLEPDLPGGRFNAVETVAATLTGLTIIDGAGGVLAKGWSSDTLPVRDAKAKYQWVRKPSGENVNRVYPDRAIRYNISGRVVMTCRVGHFGWLRRCAAIAETPPDYGFGDAAKRLARSMRVAAFAEGEDFIGATVRVPLAFSTADSEPSPAPVSPSPQP